MEENLKQIYFFDGGSQYETAAKAFTAKDIAVPIMSVGPHDLLEDVYEFMTLGGVESDPVDLVLVKNDEKIFGWIYLNYEKFFEEGMQELTAEDVAEPILPYQIVEASTTVLELLLHLTDEEYLLVVENETITRYISASELDCFPVKLCMFSIIMWLDDIINKVLQGNEDLDKHYLCLSDNARERIKAYASSNARHKSTSSKAKDLIRYASIMDKHRILKSMFRNDDESIGSHSLNDVFHKIKEVRNKIAHDESLSPVLNSAKKYANFITVTKILSMYLQKFLEANEDQADSGSG